ncbi:hypothetical protein J0J70_10350 [Turicibacter bilis]|uniref:Uncharacterized protein n=1 Tax=Turicibacter bilis TaxID=2735723 RepID=A0A9Q9FEX8_9FIRM|nr:MULTISPECIES: hypothetical protein [Turicibacter]MDD5986133.1 hypothetical protein [Turicibacter sp.]CUN39519.1 Uncharacterised protein [Turicibacter sanguinis]MBS3197902.1 hypothetical protein [Turicibacter bilis]MCU7206081.1 hypothetical protein [Turicibacter sp. GALT-G1]UUF08007.1 hypothetical protein J0J70_10350 [Turicibacter bilis]
MSYLYVLEKIEDGRLTVQQAIKEIERESKRRQKHRSKKIKLFIVDNGKRIYLPAVSFGLIKSFFRLCAPFIKFDQEAINGKFSKEEIQTILVNLEEVLKIMKEYPPLEFINVKSKNTVIKIMTK